MQGEGSVVTLRGPGKNVEKGVEGAKSEAIRNSAKANLEARHARVARSNPRLLSNIAIHYRNF